MPASDWDLAAVTAFGLEAVVARELRDLGVETTRTEDGRVWFRGQAATLCRSNLELRSAERVLAGVGRFEARDFGALFDQTRDLPWEQWIGPRAAFPVSGRSVRSVLRSVPDCQRIVKKAIVERLRSIDGGAWRDESGPEYAVEVALVDDEAILTIDTTGVGLHKRGYRREGGAAPLRETLAASLVQLSYWTAGRPFLDPLCGVGTIAIEAALWQRRIAPGLNRRFAAELWPQIDPQEWSLGRATARAHVREPLAPRLQAGDRDPRAIRQAQLNAEAAGVAEDIEFSVCEATSWTSLPSHGCLITNPPYGERLGSPEELESLYRNLGRFCRELDGWSCYVLTAYPGFETLFGRRADRRRKLYNARLNCTYYQYQGPRPPRAAVDR